MWTGEGQKTSYAEDLLSLPGENPIFSKTLFKRGEYPGVAEESGGWGGVLSERQAGAHSLARSTVQESWATMPRNTVMALPELETQPSGQSSMVKAMACS